MARQILRPKDRLEIGKKGSPEAVNDLSISKIKCNKGSNFKVLTILLKIQLVNLSVM